MNDELIECKRELKEISLGVFQQQNYYLNDVNRVN